MKLRRTASAANVLPDIRVYFIALAQLDDANELVARIANAH